MPMLIAAMVFDLGLFAGVLALGQFSPGPDMVLLTQTSLRHGRIAGWWMTLGITTGLMCHAALAISGVTSVVALSPVMRVALRLVAGLYLLWLGYKSWLETRGPEQPDDVTAARMPARKFFRAGLLCNLTNPKVVVFFSALVTPFLTHDKPLWWPWVLWFVIVAEGVVLWCCWVVMLQHPLARRIYESARNGIHLTFAVLLMVFGLVMLGSVGMVIRG